MIRIMFFCASVLLLGCNTSRVEREQAKKAIDPIDSVLKAASGIKGQYGKGKVDSTYKHVDDTVYEFQTVPIDFTAKYFGSLNKYSCAMSFVDTVSRTVYTWVKLKPGATEWTEESHYDFGALELLRDTSLYYLPEDLGNAAFEAIKDTKYGDTILLDINAELITGIDGNPVIPTLLIKNVKKMQ